MLAMNKKTDHLEPNSDNYAYGRKAVSKLETSTYNLSQAQKTMIKMSLEYEIIDIRTYRGYKGDLIVQLISDSKETLEHLKRNAKILGMQSVLKKNPHTFTFELYCIRPNTEAAYTLK